MQTSTCRRVGIVVPRFGNDVRGGAEKLALEFARHLSRTLEVDVLTTCARDYRTWRNEFPAGISALEGFRVFRFEVPIPRDPASFDRLSESLHENVAGASIEDQHRWMQEQGPMSPDLFDHLRANAENYAAVLFMPYLYATTYFGLPETQNRSLLVPLAHDEWTLRLPIVREVFEQAASALYVSGEERDLVSRRFGTAAPNGPVCAPGVEVGAGDAKRFRARFGISEPFGLYVGRIDESKGCTQLVEDFLVRRALGKNPPRLVLAGPAHAKICKNPQVLYCGEIDDQTKWDALAACDFFVMPSAFESLSFAVLEASKSAKPVIINAKSAVLVNYCRQSNGGLWYSNAAEFSAAIDAFEGGAGAIIGAQGKKYVDDHFSWEHTTAVLLNAIDRIMTRAG